MFITKMSLPRRTFLRGVGATLALPLLDAMVPALSALAKTAAQAGAAHRLHLHAERRHAGHWTPAAEGGAFELSPILQPARSRSATACSW